VPPYSGNDQELFAALKERHKLHVSRPQDDEWLGQITPRPDLLLSQAVKRGSLLPLGGGHYIPRWDGVASLEDVAPIELLVAARLDPQPCVLGYRAALAFHGLARGDGSRSFAVRGLKGTRLHELSGRPVRLVRIDEERFFGHRDVLFQSRGPLELSAYWQVTDLERTLLDCFDKPRLCGRPELAIQAFKRAFVRGGAERQPDRAVLQDYALKLGHAVTRRAAFWLQRVGEDSSARALIAHEKIHEEMLAERRRILGEQKRGLTPKRALPHPVLLDASCAYADNGHYDPDFGVVVNLPPRALAAAEA